MLLIKEVFKKWKKNGKSMQSYKTIKFEQTLDIWLFF